MKKDEKIIMYDSDEAARFVTNIEGWVSGTGMFFGNNKDSEHCARYSGSTHRTCECGKLMEKHRTLCAECCDKKDIERHKQREVVECDGESLLYSHYFDKFFHSIEEIYEHLDEMEISHLTKEELQVVACDPVYFRPVDTDYWEDCLPTEGCDEFEEVASKEVLELIGKLNEALKKCGPVSWTPGKKAVAL